jgi:hypothetical protein
MLSSIVKFMQRTSNDQKAQRIRLLAHVHRTDFPRTVKIILKWKPTASRRTERRRIRWLDDVCNDMKVMNVTVGRIGRLGMTLLRKPKPTRGCKANGGGGGGRRRRR